MCNPIMLLTAGTTMKVAGQLQEGKATQQAANQQAGLMEYQAAVDQSNALYQAKQIRRQGVSDRARSVAGAAASGVVVGQGSAGDAERQVMQDAETDAYMAILSGDRAATSQRIGAEMTRRAGRNAVRASYINATSTLLSAGAKGLDLAGGSLSGWDAKGFTGANDRSSFSLGNNSDWWRRNGTSGD